WLTLKHGLHTKGDKNIPHLLLVTSVAEGMETAACLVSRLARYVKELHGDRRVHILDLDTLDAIADTQHLHVPLFFHFSLERDHSVVLLNAQNLKAAGATQLNPFLSQGATYKYPAMAFFVAKLDSNLSESRLGMDETVAKALLGKAWVANGWEEASVRDMLSRTRSTTVFVVPEHKMPCSSGTWAMITVVCLRRKELPGPTKQDEEKRRLLQCNVLALVISIAIVDFVFGHDEAHEKAKYRAEMNKGGVEYDEGDLMDDMRMFGDVKSFLESDTMKQLASNLGKGGLSPESLLSVAGNFLGGNNKPSGKGKDPTASLSDTLDMLTKGAEMLGQIFPPNPNDDDDEENVINVEDDDDLQESVGTKRSGAGAKRGRSDDDPLQAILGQVLQSGPLQNTLMNVVGGLLNQGASESGSNKQGGGKKPAGDDPLAMAASLLSALGGGQNAGGGLGGLGAIMGLVSTLTADSSGRQKRGDDAKATRKPGSAINDDVLDMAKQLGSVFASNFMQGLSGGRNKRDNGASGDAAGGDSLGMLAALLPALMGDRDGQASTLMNLVQDFSRSDYWKTGKEMFSKVDSHQLEAFSKMVSQVMGREKASGSKSADNPFDGVVDVLLSAAMEHFGNSEGKPLPAADKKQAAESSSSPSSSRRSEAAADADESVPTVGKIVPERKINGTKPTRQVDQEDLFDALKKNGIDIDGVKENLGSVFDTKPEQGQKSYLSSKSAENLKKSSQTQDLISEALLEWAESANSENQKEARRVVVNVIKKALFNFASYGKSMDSSKFMQDLATANFAIKPKIADLIKKYKIDSDFEGMLTFATALLVKTESMDSALGDVKKVVYVLGHERMEKSNAYSFLCDILKIVNNAASKGFFETITELRKFVETTQHADFRAFARFCGKVLDGQLVNLRENDLLKLFPPVEGALKGFSNLEGMLGELDYQVMAEVLSQFFADQDIISACEKLLIPSNAEKVGTLVGNLVIGKDIQTLLPQAMGLFSSVAPSEKATAKILSTYEELHKLFAAAKIQADRKDRVGGPKTATEDKREFPTAASDAVRVNLTNVTNDEISTALHMFATEGFSLLDKQMKDQFTLFFSDFLTKLGLKLGKADDPDLYARVAEASKKITSEVMDKVAVPSTMLDMILRPHEYADPMKLAELTDKVFKSPEISRLLSLVDDFVSLNSDIESPADLVSAVIESVMESEVFGAFASLVGIGDDSKDDDSVRTQLRGYLAEPLMSLVGIYVHASEEPNCAQRWLCDFAGSVHLQLVKDSTSFWLSNAYRAGRC
ncbi:unnamed protein product, partial [Notodromas monacha]